MVTETGIRAAPWALDSLESQEDNNIPATEQMNCAKQTETKAVRTTTFTGRF